MSPALALGYLFWTRHRRDLTVLGGYWLVLIIFCLAVPPGYFRLAADQELWPKWLAFLVYALLWSSFLAALGYLVIVFTFGREARLEACESGFPVRLWALPLPTRTLAVSTMLWGSVTMTLGWATLGWAVGRPYGIDVPLAWPGLVLAVGLAWLQAILWTPLPLPWVRVFLMIPVSTILVSTPIVVFALEAPPLVISGVLALLLPAAYLTAIRGVARARRGDNVPWAWPSWLRRPWTTARPRLPFASPARAQLCFEWRRCGLVFPLIIVGYSLFWFPCMSGVFRESGLPAAVIMLFLLMLMLASVCGTLMGSNRSARKWTPLLSSFVATRPLSVGSLIRAKGEAAALSTLAAWSVLGMALLLWIVLGGYGAEIEQQFETLLPHHSAGRYAAALVALVAGGVVLTWAQMAGHFWMGLRPPDSLSYRFGRMAMFCLGWPAAFVLLDIGRHARNSPEYWPMFTDLLYSLAGVALTLKILAAGWSLSQLRRKALVPGGVLLGALATWGALAVALLLLLRWLIPPAIIPMSGLILGVLLLAPLTRLALAPLALAWNRHR